MDEAHDGSEPVPDSSVTLARRLLIRPTGSVWLLEDDRQEIGGLFTSLDAALVFARREQLHRACAIVVAAEVRTDDQRRAA